MAFQLPDDLALGPVHLEVGDLGRSIGYYRSVLGLRLLAQDGGRAAMGADGEESPLVLLDERRGIMPAPRRGRLGLYHFALLLPDRGALGRLVVHLAAMGVRVGASDHRVSEALYLTDPDGLGVEVYADRPRAEWRWRDGELLMSTDPLDLDGLAAEGGEEPWTGMPVGARMGHVHLHVGELVAAAGFYQHALGFAPTVHSYPGALFLSAGGYHHHLGLNTWAGPGAVPAGDDEAKLLEWTVMLPRQDDVDRAADRVASAGYRVLPCDGGRQLVDPWGTTLRVVARSAA